MSTALRLSRGAGLSASRLVVSLVGQLAAVPIYLTNWSAQEYGVWLILQGMFGFLILFSAAFQQYTYGELLKLGPGAPDALRAVWQGSLCAGYLIALMEFCAVLGLGPTVVSTAINAAVSSHAEEISGTVVQLLFIYSGVQLIIMPFGSLTGYVLSINGQFPRVAAWGLLNTTLVLFAPVVAVVFGAELMIAGLVYIGAHLLSGVLNVLDFARMARRFDLLERQPIMWRMSLRNTIYCLPLALRGLLDSFRQQGFRILLGGYAGAASVTTFVTTRTIANLMQQGLGTLSAPVMPELMRYVVNRDQIRMEGAFSLIWLLAFVALVPFTVVLFYFAEPFFLFWTKGAVNFDRLLFALFSTAVLIYAAGQPALTILTGQNRVAWLIVISVVAAASLGILSTLLIPAFSLHGAGFALIGAELCAMTIAVVGADRALRQSGLTIPWYSFTLVIANIASVFALFLLAGYDMAGQSLLMVILLIIDGLFTAVYWLSIPQLARDHILGSLAAIWR